MKLSEIREALGYLQDVVRGDACTDDMWDMGNPLSHWDDLYATLKGAGHDRERIKQFIWHSAVQFEEYTRPNQCSLYSGGYSSYVYPYCFFNEDINGNDFTANDIENGDVYWSDNQECYVPSGYEEEDEWGEGGGYYDGNVYDYSYDVLNECSFQALPHERMDKERGDGAIAPVRFFGVELEVRVRGNYSGSITDLVLDQLGRGNAILKDDSSIGGDGFEIVTTPATFQYQKQMIWDKFFNQESGAWQYLKSYHTGTCGIHIHVSRDSLTPLQLGRLLVLVNDPKGREVVEAVAQRESGQWAGYSDTKKITDSTEDSHRYEAINLSNSATIEFRIFRGNVSRAGFMKNLEFVDALCTFAGVCGNKGATIDNFLRWIQVPANGADYGNLRNFLWRKGYIKKDSKFNKGSVATITKEAA